MPRKTLVKNGYLPRLVDEQIERYLEVFGAVEVAGTKWCGKTWTALAHAQSVSYVDEELDMARADPKLMLIGDRPHVIDEWQLAPAIWNAVRHAIDDERGLRGAWLLTGSSTPISSDDQEGQSRHSGAGRIGSVRMYPFSLAESGESERSVSLRGLFAHRFQPAKVENDTRQLAELICRGGWPEALDLSAENGQLVAREYLRLVFEKSAPKHGKSGEVARRLCLSIARNLGQSPTYKTIISDMYGGEDNPSSLVTEQTLARIWSFFARSTLSRRSGLGAAQSAQKAPSDEAEALLRRSVVGRRPAIAFAGFPPRGWADLRSCFRESLHSRSQGIRPGDGSFDAGGCLLLSGRFGVRGRAD